MSRCSRPERHALALNSNPGPSTTDKTLKLYEGHYCDLLNDLGKEQVMEDIKDRLLEPMPKDSIPSLYYKRQMQERTDPHG